MDKFNQDLYNFDQFFVILFKFGFRVELIKFDQIECSVLENRDRLSALYQCHRSVALGEGAAHVVSTDGNYIIMEKITHLKDWYQDILEKFTGSSRNFKDYMAPYLLKMLGYVY